MLDFWFRGEKNRFNICFYDLLRIIEEINR